MYLYFTNSLLIVWELRETKGLDDLTDVAHGQEMRILDLGEFDHHFDTFPPLFFFPLREKEVQEDRYQFMHISSPI